MNSIDTGPAPEFAAGPALDPPSSSTLNRALGHDLDYCGEEPPPELPLELPPVVPGLVPLPGVELPGLVVVLLPELPPELDGELLLPEEVLPEPLLPEPEAPAPEAPEAPAPVAPERPEAPLVEADDLLLSADFFLVAACFLVLCDGVPEAPLVSEGVEVWACASCCACCSTAAIFCGSVLSLMELLAS